MAPRKTIEKELDDVQKQFDDFDGQVKSLTLDRMNMAPKVDVEQQTKMSQNQMADSKDIYLKPKRAISSKEKFDEKWRKDYEHDKEYVKFIAENREIIGESIEIWTKPYPGLPCEEWVVPVNKPIWGPRYLAEQIKKCSYHRLTMQESKIVGSDSSGQYFGQMVADNTIQRLDAIPVSNRKSIFTGAANF